MRNFNFIETDRFTFGIGLSFLFGFDLTDESHYYFNFGPFYIQVDTHV